MLNADGVPRFAMSYWATNGAELGGGYMTGVFNLSKNQELTDSINANMARGYKMSVLPVTKSFLSFMQNEDGERVLKHIFDEVAIAPYAGRAEDSFSLSASLSPIGGKMIAQQLLNSGMAGELKYCYEVTGVTPVFHAKIRMDFDKVYTHFVASSRGRWGWFKWNVRHEVEKLVSSKNIEITINGGDATQNDYIMEITERLMKDFFVEQTQNRRAGSSGRTFSVSYIRIEEHRELKYELKQRKIVDREYCIGLGMDGIKQFPWLVTHVQ